jgi:AraC-like DNA-binding protein
MSTPTPGLHPMYLRLLAAALARHGVDAGAALAGPLATAGIDHATLAHRDALLPLDALPPAIDAALSASGCPWLGLELGAQAQPFSHGPVGLAAVASGSVRQALEVACRYMALRAPLLEASLREDARGLVLVLAEAQPLGDARRFVFEATAVMLERLLQALSARDLAEATWELPWPEPAWSAHYAGFLAGRRRFAARRCALRLPAALADAPCLGADPAAYAFARAECERRLAEGAAERDLQARVRRRLWTCEGDWPDAAAMAAALGMSPRGFFRALAAAGTGYRALLEEARAERACRLLRDTSLAVEAVALQLGYADASNFSRCFRRWTGSAPAAWRRMHGPR